MQVLELHLDVDAVVEVVDVVVVVVVVKLQQGEGRNLNPQDLGVRPCEEEGLRKSLNLLDLRVPQYHSEEDGLLPLEAPILRS